VNDIFCWVYLVWYAAGGMFLVNHDNNNFWCKIVTRWEAYKSILHK
jgi:hypothetical protein